MQFVVSSATEQALARGVSKVWDLFFCADTELRIIVFLEGNLAGLIPM